MEIEMEPDDGRQREQDERQQYELLHPTERQLMERLHKELEVEIANFRSFCEHFNNVFKEFK